MSARVLVVDDIPTNVKLLQAKLTREYYEVITAGDGPAALAAAQERQPDVILLDVMMPGMDGFEVCRRLKADSATTHIPVIMVTALSETSDRVHGLEAGADDFLTKPVNDTALFARIRSLARLKMSMDEWRRREETCDQFGILSEGQPPVAEDATKARVLIVEKSAPLRARLTGALEPDGTELIAPTERDEILALAGSGELDLAIVGALPWPEDSDALRLCSQLRSHEVTRQLPILLMVEEHDVAGLAKGLDLGINDYIVKPVDSHEFLARARTQIRKKRYQDRLRLNFERSLTLALTDSLTGLYNHRYAGAHLRTMMQRGTAGAKPVGMLMVDIDFFKSINDRHGHAAGDEVLCGVAERICRSVRSVDVVARLGGEEFVVMIPDADREIISTISERLRATIAESPFSVASAAGPVNVTVSVGAALSESGEPSPEVLLRRADEAMYQAKRQGRNQVVAALSEDKEEGAEIAAR